MSTPTEEVPEWQKSPEYQQFLRLQAENRKMTEYLQRFGINPDAVGMRHELMFNILVETGVIPLEVWNRFEFEFAHRVHAELREAIQTAEAKLQEQQKEQARQTLLRGVPGIPRTH